MYTHYSHFQVRLIFVVTALLLYCNQSFGLSVAIEDPFSGGGLAREIEGAKEERKEEAKEDWPFKWFTNFNQAQGVAKQRNRCMMVVFSGSDWCGWCKKLDSEVFQSAVFKEYARNSVVSVMLDTPQAQLSAKPYQALMAKYKVEGYPAVLILDKAGKLLGRGGYVEGGPQAFIKFLTKYVVVPKKGAKEVDELDRSPGAILQALQSDMARSPASDEIDKEKQYYLDIKLGNWPAAKSYLGSLPKEEARTAYDKLLKALKKTRDVKTKNRQYKRLASVLTLKDFFGVCDCCPEEIGDKDLKSLAGILGRIMESGDYRPHLLAMLEEGTARFGGKDEKKRLAAARLLFAVNMVIDAGQYLPDPKRCMASKDIESVKLHIKYLAQKARSENDEKALSQAWVLGQWILLDDSSAIEERQAAFAMTLSLIPTLDEELASMWLEERFRQNPVLGMSILTAVGNAVSSGVKGYNLDERGRNISMLALVVESLLSSVNNNQWDDALDVLAWCWIMEADITSVSYRKPNRNNRYGYRYEHDSRQENIFVPVKEVLDVAPDTRWLKHLKPDTRLKVLSLIVDLSLKVDDLDGAMNAIKLLAKENPEKCPELISEYLQAWSVVSNNTPIEMDNNMMMMIRMGYMSHRVYNEGIPLTRARQIRNLNQLAELFKEVDKITSEPVDPSTAASVFAECHSMAEVFLKEDIIRVFGEFDSILFAQRIELITVMRGRLADAWAKPETQQKARTNRSESQVQAELSRGYRVLEELIQSGMDDDNWQYHRLKAMVMYDSAGFYYSLRDQKGVSDSDKYSLAEYIRQRDASLESFKKSALCYSKVAPGLKEAERSVLVYLHWFYVTLGGSDLAHLKRSSDYNRDFLADIRKAILSLPDGLVEEHLKAFGENIQRVSSQVGPDIKMRFLKASFEILGDHPSGEKSRKLLDYYDELLGELKLTTRIDSKQPGGIVGHKHPFGLFIELKHTRNIERESGGFGRYLQDAINNPYYGGSSSQVNHREVFRKYITESLQKNFNIHSLVFSDPSVLSRKLPAGNWSITPMAYCVLQAKDKSVDMIPPVQIDLDFSDTVGKVVLPILADTLPIDAKPEGGNPVVSQLEVTQVLDDRDMAKGKLKLQIDVKANGIIPAFDQLFESGAVGVELKGTVEDSDRGLVLDKLDTEAERIAPICQRSWNLEFSVPADLDIEFQYPVVSKVLSDAKVSNKRYDDADLVDAEPVVKLEHRTFNYRPYLYAAALIAVLSILSLVFLRKKKGVEEVARGYALPEKITPFTLLSLLRHIESDNTLAISESDRELLHKDIGAVEHAYFSTEESSDPTAKPELNELAQKYIGLVKISE